MTDSQIDLWTRLSEFSIDRGTVALPFHHRLARENGWSVAYAERVVEEYKRFLFLCAESGHMCTPSEEVDQAWHLHMVYTRSYWDGLCGSVLGRPLHHDPTEGGASESAKFYDWYGRTLDSYRRFFGEPPADIWPASEARFRRDPNPPRRFLLSAASLTAVLAAGGCVASASAANTASSMALAVAFIAIFICIIAVGLAIANANRSGRRGGDSGSGCGSSGCGSASDGDSGGGGCGGGCGGGD